MPWFWIWTCLIIASLVVGFFLLRHLWHKMSAFTEELARANDVLADLSTRTSELTEALEKIREAHIAAKPDPFDAEAAHKQIADVRKKRRRKKARRRLKHGAKRRTWRDIAIDPRFDRWRAKK